MKLSPVAFAVSAATIWGAAILVIGSINSMIPGYGDPVLSLVVSLYPGYDASGGFGDLMLGTFYAVVDGLAAGAVFALIYNFVVGITSSSSDADAAPAASVPTAEPPGEDGTE